MTFEIEISDNGIFPVIYLKNNEEKTGAEIYSFGALLNAFKINNSINIVDGFASPQDVRDNITNGFKSAKLSPFVCRINGGKYSFNGHQYKTGKFFLGEEAIHGLLYDAVFSIVDSGATQDEAFVALKYHYSNSDEGFPFNYDCTVHYSLKKNNSITLTTSIKNLSDSEMPVCDGWHPYFTLHKKIDELSLQINANKMLEFSEKLIPTGNIISYTKFQQPEIFGVTILDNCFQLNENDAPACVLKNTTSGLQLTITPESSYPYLQLYTPEHRNSIAIENLSAAPDAFNNKIGLKVLQPNEEISFRTTYSVSLQS